MPARPTRFRVQCPHCNTTFDARPKQTTTVAEGPHNAQLQPRMHADFARWYLWAKLMEETHPEDQDAKMLVRLLRQADDIEQRHMKDPTATPSNLSVSIGDTIVLVVRRLLAKYKEAAVPVG